MPYVDDQKPEEVTIHETELRAWFAEQLQRKDAAGRRIGQRHLAAELDVNQATVSRNARRLKSGEPLAASFQNVLHDFLVERRREELRQRRLAEQRDAEVKRIETERLALEEAERIEAQRIEEARQAQAEANRIKAQRELEERKKRVRVLEALAPWRDKLRQAGIIAMDDQALHGDAEELVAAGVTDVTYLNDGVAAVALAPDAYEFPGGMTAAELREGVTATQRMQPSVVPEGEPRPLKIGKRQACFVPMEGYSDEEHFYGDDYGEIQEWRRLKAECGHLALGPLPKFISPEKVSEFERLLQIERTSRYEFEGTVLRADAEDRLRILKRRRIVSFIRERILGIMPDVKTLFWFAAAAAAVVGICASIPTLWELLQSFGGALSSGGTAAGAWVDRWKWELLSVIAALAATALAGWWVWPKERDKDGQLGGKLIAIGCGIVVIGSVVLVLEGFSRGTHVEFGYLFDAIGEIVQQLKAVPDFR